MRRLVALLSAVLVLGIGCTGHHEVRRQKSAPSASPSSASAHVSENVIPSETVLGIAMVGPTSGWVLTDHRFMYTEDVDTGWTPAWLPAPLPVSEYGISPDRFFVDGSTAWALDVGKVVAVYRASGGRVDAYRVPQRPNETVADGSLSFLTSKKGWVDVVYAKADGNLTSSDLLRTEDGGRSWILVGAKTPVLGPIYFATSSEGWALQNPLLRTTDGGRTWHRESVPVQFDPSLPGNFTAMSLFGRRGVLQASVSTGMQGHPVFSTSRDGGQTWNVVIPKAGDDQMSYFNTGPPFRLAIVDALHWRASVYASVFATDDGGLTWRTVATNVGFRPIDGISFATPDVGWAFSSEPDACFDPGCLSVLMATKNGGRSWYGLPLPLNGSIVRFARKCSAAQLTLQAPEPVSEATGQHTNLFALRNDSAGGCYLVGYPGIDLLNARGVSLPFTYLDTGDQMVTGRSPDIVPLPPGRSVYFAINKYRCDLGEKEAAVTITVTLPDENGSLTVQLPTGSGAQETGYCGANDPGSVVHVSPFEATNAQTLAAH